MPKSVSDTRAASRATTSNGTLNGNNKNTVQGTFEDLSEEEKTRALLQFLQYHQQQEQESETSRFKEMIQNGENKQEGLGNLSRAEIQVKIDFKLEVF